MIGGDQGAQHRIVLCNCFFADRIALVRSPPHRFVPLQELDRLGRNALLIAEDAGQLAPAPIRLRRQPGQDFGHPHH